MDARKKILLLEMEPFSHLISVSFQKKESYKPETFPLQRKKKNAMNKKNKHLVKENPFHSSPSKECISSVSFVFGLGFFSQGFAILIGKNKIPEKKRIKRKRKRNI